MYNVLETLRAGDDLSEDEERIKAEGLVITLKSYHDDLDRLVCEAYGWPPSLTDAEILSNLVALNATRRHEEQGGSIRWLRPTYQIPRFGSDAEKAQLEAERSAARARSGRAQAALDLDDDLQEMKRRFPTGNELAETVEVTRVLAASRAPMSIADVSRYFAQGRQVEKRVELTIHALMRLGQVTSVDDARTFTLRPGP